MVSWNYKGLSVKPEKRSNLFGKLFSEYGFKTLASLLFVASFLSNPRVGILE
jgi:hypothetical protein